MGKQLFAYLLTLFLLIYTGLSAQELPLVYNTENTGADCPVPYLPSYNELPRIYSLPDPFEWSDGRGRISHFSDWRYRRAEIKAEIEHYEIGEKPDRPEDITARYSNNTLTVNITVNGKTLTLTSQIILPSGNGPFPAVIGVGGGSGSLPADLFTSRNIAQIPFNFGQVMAHQQTRGSEPINELYPELTYIGAYSAWSWGVSRLIDGLELVASDLPIDLSRLAVTGCSFAGKMALFAGALDERIALTISQESGGGGYTTWRFSETLGNVETLGRTDHTWFIQDMFQFSSAVEKLPHDHHELMALVAPRALLVLGNPDYEWLADESGYVGSKAAKEVYKALGIPDRFGFSIVGGHGHCALPSSQRPEVGAFIDKFLLGEQAETEEISVSPYNTDLSGWISWETPELTEGDSYFGKSTLISPVTGSSDLDTSVILIWSKAENAGTYLIQSSNDPAFSELLDEISISTDTTHLMSGLQPGYKYYWRVQVKNEDGLAGPWSNASNFSTFISEPGVPTPISAVPVPNRTDYITLTWGKPDNASSYYVQLSTLQSFARLASSASTTDTAKTLNGTEEGGEYFWRVQSRNIGGSSAWSEVVNFTFIMPPTDLSAERSGDNNIVLSWEDNSSVEEGYIIEHKQGEESSYLVLDTLAADYNSFTDYNLSQPLIYTYRVKAVLGNGSSLYSNEASITLVGVRMEDVYPDSYSLSQNYPNPFNPDTKIAFVLPKSGRTKIILYDLVGSEMGTIIDGSLEAGYHEVSLDVNNNGTQLTSGVYFYRISSGDFVCTKKMILMK